MLSKPQIYNLLRHPIGQNHKITKLQHLFCTLTESPDLPSWFNQTQPIQEENEDFVIPSLASWIQETNTKSNSSKLNSNFVVNDSNSVMESICSVLKQRFSSPDRVVESLNGCRFDVSSSVLDQVLRRFSNDWVPAYGVFLWAKGRDGFRCSPGVYDFVVDVLGKAKRFGDMWEVVEEMGREEGLVSGGTMSRVIRRLARAGKYGEAVDAFKEMGRFGVKVDTGMLDALLDALVKEGSVEVASSSFLEFRDSVGVSSRTFNILIHGWCRVRKFENAREVMEDMGRYGFEPDVVSYTSFIEAYCREKNFRKVDEVLDEMRKKGCKPNAVSYTIIMHSYGKAKQVSEALEVYEKMKQNGCVPDASFYSSLIYILGKAGRMKDAQEVFEDMGKQGVTPDVVTYNTLIASACEHSQAENALKLLKKMEEDSCKPDIKTYAPLLKMCCRKKWMKVLYFLLDHMFKNDLSIELGTYSLLVHGLCKSGKLEHACSFFEEMVSKGMRPKDITYKKLMDHLEARSMVEAKEQITMLMQGVKKPELV